MSSTNLTTSMEAAPALKKSVESSISATLVRIRFHVACNKHKKVGLVLGWVRRNVMLEHTLHLVRLACIRIFWMSRGASTVYAVGLIMIALNPHANIS